MRWMWTTIGAAALLQLVIAPVILWSDDAGWWGLALVATFLPATCACVLSAFIARRYPVARAVALLATLGLVVCVVVFSREESGAGVVLMPLVSGALGLAVLAVVGVVTLVERAQAGALRD